MDYADAIWTKPQLIDRLGEIDHLLQSQVFKHAKYRALFSQKSWIELILAVSDLVRQSSLAGKRIDFTDEVSVQDQTKDITSLLDSMRQMAYLVRPILPAQHGLKIILPALNQMIGIGSGQFRNGLLYHCPYKNERTFFMGHDRIYFYRHLMRAYFEAGHYLISLPSFQ